MRFFAMFTLVMFVFMVLFLAVFVLVMFVFMVLFFAVFILVVFVFMVLFLAVFILVVFIVSIFIRDWFNPFCRNYACSFEARSLYETLDPTLEFKSIYEQKFCLSDCSSIGRSWLVDVCVTIRADESCDRYMFSPNAFHHVAQNRKTCYNRNRFNRIGISRRRE